MNRFNRDKTFSVCDIIRIWDENLTDDEQSEIVTFFNVVVPSLGASFDLLTFFSGVLNSQSAVFGAVVDGLGKIRISRRVQSLRELEKVFKTRGSAQCVYEFVQQVIRQSNIT